MAIFDQLLFLLAGSFEVEKLSGISSHNPWISEEIDASGIEGNSPENLHESFAWSRQNEEIYR